ncbi:MAG: NTP transferase domain-containing protein [Gammaproteobacteria bacterium]|nr:NTP transferase domain-containing protein [Gammaproteobacteria bacterium]
MSKETPDELFTALVLAADRNPDDPVARAAGVKCKALAPVDGTPMVMSVLKALARSHAVGPRLLCGPPRPILESSPPLRAGIDAGSYQWMENRESPSASVAAALEGLSPSQPMLLTTADHALLNNRIVDYFCGKAKAADYDLAVALAPHELVSSRFPGVRRTVLRFRDNPCCSCNLFALMTPASRSVPDFWRKVESQRKKPWKVVGILGWWSVIQYLLHRLTLEQALKRVSGILGIRVGAVILPYPEAAVDVDSENDLAFVNQLLAERKASDRPAV